MLGVTLGHEWKDAMLMFDETEGRFSFKNKIGGGRLT